MIPHRFRSNCSVPDLGIVLDGSNFVVEKSFENGGG